VLALSPKPYVWSMIWGMRKRSSPIDLVLAKEAKSIIALALRHGPSKTFPPG
jgi:hypothetical protein